MTLDAEPLSLSVNRLATVASAIGEPARAAILSALMGGSALAAGELALCAGVSPQTTSAHLARLRESGLITDIRQGRHRYYRLASPDIADLLESLMVVAASPTRNPGPRDDALRRARTCYDHLAGRAGVALASALVDLGAIGPSLSEARLSVAAVEMLQSSLDLRLDLRGARPACRACLDWSERKPHLGGALGAAILEAALDRGWFTRIGESRALQATRAGETELRRTLGIVWVRI